MFSTAPFRLAWRGRILKVTFEVQKHNGFSIRRAKLNIYIIDSKVFIFTAVSSSAPRIPSNTTHKMHRLWSTSFTSFLFKEFYRLPVWMCNFVPDFFNLGPDEIKELQCIKNTNASGKWKYCGKLSEEKSLKAHHF